MSKTKIISISGIDGSGKSTQLNNLKEYFDSQNLKSKILKVKYTPYHKYKCDALNTDLLRSIMALEFVTYYNEKIKELEDYDYLLCDRSKACLLAYGLTYGLKDAKSVYEILKLTRDPDLLFYFDMDPKKSIERIKKGRGNLEEDESLENLEKDKLNYNRVFKDYNFSPIYVDATEDENIIFKKLVYTINNKK